MISKKLLSVVLGFEVIPATGKELLEHSFGYDQGIRTRCAKPLKDDEWINVKDGVLTFGYIDKRPKVLKNIPKGVYTSKSINVYELAHLCKEWANKCGIKGKNYQMQSSLRPQSLGGAYCEVWSGAFQQTDDDFESNSEPEAIFKACEWILGNNESL